jgi:hypothetical protein
MRADLSQQLMLQEWARDHASASPVGQPEHWPEHASLDPRGLLPLSHGDHGHGHSGVYAAVNAIRLVSAGHHAWSDRDDEQLLAKAWDWQTAHGPRRPNRGMRVWQWHSLVDALAFAFGRKHGHFLQISRPWQIRRPGRAEFFTTVERLIVGRHAVLGLFAGAQYSVIRGFTPLSLLLFDSGYREWIARKSVRSNDGPLLGRHRIVPSATLALSRRI